MLFPTCAVEDHWFAENYMLCPYVFAQIFPRRDAHIEAAEPGRHEVKGQHGDGRHGHREHGGKQEDKANREREKQHPGLRGPVADSLVGHREAKPVDQIELQRRRASRVRAQPDRLCRDRDRNALTAEREGRVQPQHRRHDNARQQQAKDEPHNRPDQAGQAQRGAQPTYSI